MAAFVVLVRMAVVSHLLIAAYKQDFPCERKHLKKTEDPYQLNFHSLLLLLS